MKFRRCMVVEPFYTKNLYQDLDAVHFLTPRGMKVINTIENRFISKIQKAYLRSCRIPAFFITTQYGGKRLSKLEKKINA